MKKRILACLEGIATGDAVGKQTEGLAREGVARWYPEGVRGFEGSPGSVIPRYAGHHRHAWRIGETTDDTERTIAVARAILEDGEVRHASVGRELLTCSKCVHPGVRSLWEFHQAGDATRVTTQHDGCGAAIRVAPVGVLHSSGRLDEIVNSAKEASIPTHGGPFALAAAAAAAAAVSAAIDGAEPREIIELAERAATQAECERTGSTDAVFARAMHALYADLSQQSDLDAAEIASKYFPDNPLTIVPLAIALASILQSAERAILLAANIGGDSDSVASIAGSILGARCPDTVNEEWFAVVEMINDHGLIALGEELSKMRR
ncbi:MAG TPA: ADP-ribosylglycohydrolase family protein [Vicinamibacterales bacterium]|nr:ADP-ribosylglycohydrolase family protein [Vicinamibacterales bacterium]